MTLCKLCSVTAVALALSGCVVLDTAPPEAVGPGPFLTGNFNAPAAAPAPAPAAAPDLGSQLAGRTLTHPSLQGGSITLRADGRSVQTGANGAQVGGGRWYTEGRQLCLEGFGGGFDCGIVVITGSTLTLTAGNGRTATYTIL